MIKVNVYTRDGKVKAGCGYAPNNEQDRRIEAAVQAHNGWTKLYSMTLVDGVDAAHFDRLLLFVSNFEV